ncbi:MAG: efflux RND transporter periplasmic adaptor subunit [Chloroflexi bacterium]|nr:efflux RND transporter periplasmic adaptor subunit [Chloroflexota bacterium]
MDVETGRDGMSVRTAGQEAKAVPAVPAPPRHRTNRFGHAVFLVARIAAPVAVLAGAVGLFQHMQSTRPAIVHKPTEERVWFVDTVTVARTVVTPRLELYGTIVAGREVELRPLVSGQVVRVASAFAEGGIVHRGDLLVEIDPFDYRIAVDERKADRAEARARRLEIEVDLKGEKALIAQERELIDLFRRNLERRRALHDSGTVSVRSLENAQRALVDRRQRLVDRLRRTAILDARLTQQDAVIARAEGALARAVRALRDTRLVAPFNGFLSGIATGIGKAVSSNDRIARLADAGKMEVQFQVSDAEYARLARDGALVGRPVTVLWRTRDWDIRYSAVIERVAAGVSNGSGGIDLFARLHETDTTTLLRPGVFVEVAMADAIYRDVYRLPDEGLHEGRFVYVVVDDRLARREVTPAGRIGNDILVRGRIEDGDRIVARTFPEIGPGLRVGLPSSSEHDTPAAQ